MPCVEVNIRPPNNFEDKIIPMNLTSSERDLEDFAVPCLYLYEMASQFVILPPSIDGLMKRDLTKLDHSISDIDTFYHIIRLSGTNVWEKKQSIAVSAWMARHSTMYLKVFTPQPPMPPSRQDAKIFERRSKPCPR